MSAPSDPRTDQPIDEEVYRGIDLDHTSFAVPDALATARILRRELGATPVAGETLPDFRQLLLHVGTAEAGARLELLERVGEAGFLSRFLHKHGPGPHHITFNVPDLRSAVARARDAGATVVGEDYNHEPWAEAFRRSARGPRGGHPALAPDALLPSAARAAGDITPQS